MPTAVAQIRRGSIRERAGSPSPGHVSSGGLCTAGAASEAAEEGRVDKQTTPSRAPERNQAEDEGPAHEDKKQLPSLNAGCGTAPVRGAFGTLAEHSGTKAGHWEWGNNDAASAIDSPQAWLGRREGKNRALPFLTIATTACTVARSDTTLLGAELEGSPADTIPRGPKDTIPPRIDMMVGIKDIDVCKGQGQGTRPWRTLLANELIDLVIDQLRDDEPSLRTCSLVSRQWIPRSRLHNFSSAKLIIDTIEMRDGIQFAPGAMRLDAFLDLVASPLATFIGILQDLTLRHTLDGNAYTRMNILRPMDILRRLETRGVRVCKLDLSCNALFTLPYEGPPPFTSSLTALDIDLLNADGETRLSFVFNFICSYPKLEQLTLVDGYGGLEIGTLMALELPTSLRSLTTGYLPLVKWIVALEVPPTHINTLGLVDAGARWFLWEGLNSLLSGPIAHNLHTLTLTDIRVDGSYPLDLSNFYNLRHLRVLREVYESAPETLLYLFSHLNRSPARKTIERLT
ncbi:hypothetical protein C8F01DRAFT_1348398 [Mycena amicta]|nr:hypothetical protein C8F01DRAFT_1348398 [Mycena amicta]